MARRGLIAFAAARLLAAGSCSDSDVVSMLQHEVKAAEPEMEVAMENWLGQYYRLLRTKQDPVLTSCCALAKRAEISPFFTWGKATEAEMNWWNEVDCNAAVGADEPEHPKGVPNCESMSMLTNLVPKSLAKEPIELYSSESGCSAEDRDLINRTFYGEEDPDVLPIECAPSRLIEKSAVKWDTFSMCVRRIFGGVSSDCSECYTAFMRDVGGNTRMGPDNKGCMKTCYGLEACASLYYCAKQSTWCATCIQPALNRYHQCMGGPVENQLNMEDIMRKLVHVWGTLGNLKDTR